MIEVIPASVLNGWLFLVGTVIGSFLNVVIARVPEGLSVVRPPSRCPKCGHQLPWYENVPIFSWLFLRGKCSGCKSPISPRYVAVEALTGLLFVACAARFGWTWPLVPALVFVSFLIPLIFIDAEHWILPHELTLPGIGCGIALQIPLGWPAVTEAFWGALLAFLIFRAMEYFGWLAFRKEALGAGDKILFAMVGAYLGPRALLGVVFLSSFQGAVFGLLKMAFTGRAGPADEAPGTPADPNAPAATEEKPDTLTWEFMKAGLPWWRRVLVFPVAVLLQGIPDERTDEATGEEVEWKPGATNLPFGPWIGLAGLELLLLGRWLAETLPIAGSSLLFGR